MSVTGFSRLEYVLAVAEKCYEELAEGRTRQISQDEVYDIVLRTASWMEKRWIREVGRRGGKKAGQIIASKCLEALKKWNLIGKKDNSISEKIVTIGKLLVEKKNEKLARRELLDAIFSSRRDKPFHPSHLWVSIRNSKVTFLKTTFRIKGKKGNIEGPMVRFEGEDGVAYDHEPFLKKVPTNFFALDIMRDWGEFFGVLNYYPLDREKIQTELKSWIDDYKKDNGYDIKLRWPRYGIYLTVILASVEELMKALILLRNRGELTFQQLVEELKLNTYACNCIVQILHEIGLISVTQENVLSAVKDKISLQKLLEAGKEKALIISDGPEIYGIVTNKFDQLQYRLKREKTYFIIEPEIQLNDFKRIFTKNYAEAVKDRFGIPVWISELAFSVCKELRISRRLYDNFILKLYNMDYVNFYRSTTHLAGREYRARRPLYYQNTAYYLVSIG